MKPQHISKFSYTLTASIFIVSFGISYVALRHYAAVHGMGQIESWFWPYIVDGFIAIGSLALLRAELMKESSRYPWALVILGTLASTTFNVLHAPGGLYSMSAVIFGFAPIAAALSLHLSIEQLRHDIERDMAVQSLTALRTELDTLGQAQDTLQTNVDNLGQTRDSLRTELDTLGQERDMIQTDIPRLKSSKTRAMNDLDKLRTEYAELQTLLKTARKDLDNLTHAQRQTLLTLGQVAYLYKSGQTIDDIAGVISKSSKTVGRHVNLLGIQNGH